MQMLLFPPSASGISLQVLYKDAEKYFAVLGTCYLTLYSYNMQEDKILKKLASLLTAILFLTANTFDFPNICKDLHFELSSNYSVNI